MYLCICFCMRLLELAEELWEKGQQAGFYRAMHQKAVEREKKLKQELEAAKAEIKQLKRKIFGRKSEGKGKPDQGPDGQKAKGKRRGQRKGSRGHGRRRRDLPEEVEFSDLADVDKVCSTCNRPFSELPFTKTTEELVIEVKAHQRVVRRRQYTQSCSCGCHSGIITAPMPAKLIPRGYLGVSVWVMLLLDKFLFQRPTYRLLMDLRLTLGLDIPQGTVTGGFKRLAPAFEPLNEPLIEKSRQEDRWHADETSWQVFYNEETKEIEVKNRWNLWVFHSPSVVVFKIDPTREARVALEHFGEEAEGILNADRYAVYKVVAKGGRIVLAFCWAHVRRDFIGVARGWPQLDEWAFGWVDKIGELYRLNKERLAQQNCPEAYSQAQAKLEEAVENFAKERDAELADPTLHSAAKRVLTSLENHWSGLVVFVEHPEVPMDNNQAERDLRNPVVGRNNYYGSGSHWSAQLTALLFSIFQTVLLWKINPRTWLTSYLQACAENGGKAPVNAEMFLPWNMSKEQLCNFQRPAVNDSS